MCDVAMGLMQRKEIAHLRWGHWSIPTHPVPLVCISVPSLSPHPTFLLLIQLVLYFFLLFSILSRFRFFPDSFAGWILIKETYLSVVHFIMSTFSLIIRLLIIMVYCNVVSDLVMITKSESEKYTRTNFNLYDFLFLLYYGVKWAVCEERIIFL